MFIKIAISSFVFLIMVTFSPYQTFGAIMPRWSLLAIGLPVLLCFHRVNWTWQHTALTAFVGWCALTTLWSNSWLDSVGSLGILAVLVGSFVVASEQRSAKPVVIGLSAGIAVNACVAVIQHFYQYDLPWIESAGPGGLFGNRGPLSELAALCIVACLTHRFWLGLPMAVTALFFSWSRGSLLALGAAGWLWLWRRDKLMAFGVAVFVLGFVPQIVQVRVVSVDERLTIWTDTIKAITPFGAGIGTFGQNYPLLTDQPTLMQRPDEAHNDYIQFAYETGLVGLTLLLTFFASCWFGPNRYLLVVVLVEAFFAFPLQKPASIFMAGCVAGLCVADRWRRVSERAERVTYLYGGETGEKHRIGTAGSKGLPVVLRNEKRPGIRSEGPDKRTLDTGAGPVVSLGHRFYFNSRPQQFRYSADSALLADYEPCGRARNPKRQT